MLLGNLTQRHPRKTVTDDQFSVHIQRLPADLPSVQFRPSHSSLDPFDDQAALQLGNRSDDFSLLAAMLLIAGCGGGSVGTPIAAPTPTPATPVRIQGQWQVIAQSTNSGTGVLIETNLSQSGSNVTAAKSSVVLIEGAPRAYIGLGGECDNRALGNDSIQATVSGQTLSLTLTEAGSLGTDTSTGTATISSDGTQITSGIYTTPAACGFLDGRWNLHGRDHQAVFWDLCGDVGQRIRERCSHSDNQPE
jgi:hypothetical protein